MNNLLNLLAAIALLVWGTHLVRAGILRVFGANLRDFLSHSLGNRFTAMAAGVGVTAVVQSSTATALIVSSFVGQGVVTLPIALAVMLGADVGTSLMVVVFSFDLSWLSPLAIFSGVVLFISRPSTPVGRFGRVLIGLGLILLALKLITASTEVLVQSPAVKALLASLGTDVVLEILVGAVIAILAYSSLATVLLTATLAATGVIPLTVAIGLVLGANLGSGLLAVITTAKSSLEVRQVPLGNLVFKALGVLVCAPFAGLWLQHAQPWLGGPANVVVMFHLAFNLVVAVLFIGFTQTVAAQVLRFLPRKDTGLIAGRPHHLDPSALSTPSLDRHHQLHDQHGAGGRHHRARPHRHRGQEDPQRAAVLRGRHGRDLRVARAADGQPAPGHERVPQRQRARCQALAGREGALSRPGARLRGQPHRAPDRQHRGQHRDKLAAYRPDQRAQAHQLAAVLDRLPHP